MVLIPDQEPALCGISPIRPDSWGESADDPSTATVPEAGRIRSVQHRISVVLPAPFGPSTAVSAPVSASSESPSRTARWPNLTTKSATRTALSGLGTDEF
jgi:hypothetical protein